MLLKMLPQLSSTARTGSAGCLIFSHLDQGRRHPSLQALSTHAATLYCVQCVCRRNYSRNSNLADNFPPPFWNMHQRMGDVNKIVKSDKNKHKKVVFVKNREKKGANASSNVAEDDSESDYEDTDEDSDEDWDPRSVNPTANRVTTDDTFNWKTFYTERVQPALSHNYLRFHTYNRNRTITVPAAQAQYFLQCLAHPHFQSDTNFRIYLQMEFDLLPLIGGFGNFTHIPEVLIFIGDLDIGDLDVTERSLGDLDATERSLDDLDATERSLDDLDATERSLDDLDATERSLMDDLVPIRTPPVTTINYGIRAVLTDENAAMGGKLLSKILPLPRKPFIYRDMGGLYLYNTSLTVAGVRTMFDEMAGEHLKFEDIVIYSSQPPDLEEQRRFKRELWKRKIMVYSMQWHRRPVRTHQDVIQEELMYEEEYEEEEEDELILEKERFERNSWLTKYRPKAKIELVTETLVVDSDDDDKILELDEDGNILKRYNRPPGGAKSNMIDQVLGSRGVTEGWPN